MSENFKDLNRSGCDEEDATSDDEGQETIVQVEKSSAGRHRYNETDLANLPDLIKANNDHNSGDVLKKGKSKVKKKRK